MDAAQRIYQASTREEPGDARLAERLARQIEDDIASHDLPAGDGLGSLRDLSRRYCAGRAATREAVGLLERRGLGRLRPGPSGGFIVSSPTAIAVGRELAEYFQSTASDQRSLADAREAIAGFSDESAFEPLLRCLNHSDSGLSEARVGLSVTDERTLSGSLASRIAAEIVEDGRPGQRIGSEWDLCERYGVSRLTLRQAIRLLQDGGFVECRRGRGNGLVIHNRRRIGTMRLLLAFFIGSRLDVRNAGTMLFRLNRFIPALAVERASPAQIEDLKKRIAKIAASDPIDRVELLSLVQFVSQLADSPIIDFYSRCLAAHEARFHPALPERLPRKLQIDYFSLVENLLKRAPFETAQDLAKAKAQSSKVLLEMSLSRPI